MGRNEEMSKFSFCSRILLTSHSTFCPFYLWIRFQMAPCLMELKALMSGIFLFFFLSYGFEFFNRKCTIVTYYNVKRLVSWLYMQCNFNIQYKLMGGLIRRWCAYAYEVKCVSKDLFVCCKLLGSHLGKKSTFKVWQRII